MTLKTKILFPYKKTLSWLKNTRVKRLQDKLNELSKSVDTRFNSVNAISGRLNLINDLIEKEEKARREQVSSIKSGIKKELTKCIKEYKATEEESYIVGLEQRVNNIVDDLCTSIKSKEEHLLDIMSGCRKVITELNMAENDFLEVKILGDKAKREYHIYLDQLKREFIKNGEEFLDKILTFKETDQASRRLASIEERCTMLEMKLK